jgi:ankyrin repeat protein
MSYLGTCAVQLTRSLTSHRRPPPCRTSDGATALMIAASIDELAMMEALVEHGAAVDAVYPADGRTAYHTSCAHGRAEAVGLLVRLGCNQTLRDNEQMTGLECAREGGHAALVDTLEAAEAQQLQLMLPDVPVEEAEPRAVALPPRMRSSSRVGDAALESCTLTPL